MKSGIVLLVFACFGCILGTPLQLKSPKIDKPQIATNALLDSIVEQLISTILSLLTNNDPLPCGTISFSVDEIADITVGSIEISGLSKMLTPEISIDGDEVSLSLTVDEINVTLSDVNIHSSYYEVDAIIEETNLVLIDVGSTASVGFSIFPTSLTSLSLTPTVGSLKGEILSEINGLPYYTKASEPHIKYLVDLILDTKKEEISLNILDIINSLL